MRKIYNFLTIVSVLLVLCGVMPSQAQVKPVAFSQSDPAEGSTVESLEKIPTFWDNVTDDYGRTWIDKADKQAVEVTTLGEHVCYGSLRNFAGEFNQVQINLDQVITEPGVYYVNIKAGVIANGVLAEDESTANPEAGTENEATTLVFNVGKPDVPVTLASSDPVSGSTVESLYAFQTDWNEVQSEWGAMWVDTNNKEAIEVKLYGDHVCYGKFITNRGEYNQLFVQLGQEITEPGAYEVTIKAGAVGSGLLCDNWMTKNLVAGTENEAVTLMFNVATPDLPVVLAKTDPEDGSTVDELAGFQVYWDNVQSEIGSVWVDKNDKEAVEVTLGGEHVCFGKLGATHGDFNQIQVTLDQTITEPGEYKVTIKAGTVCSAILSGEDFWTKIPIEGSYNAETVLTFKVERPVLPVALDYTDPADGSTVESLDKIPTFWANVTDDYGRTWIDKEDKEAVEVTMLGEHVCYGSLRNFAGEYNQIQINLDEVITAPGYYSVIIKAGVIADGLLDEETFSVSDVPGTKNKETVLHYIVGNPALPIEFSHSDPENGSTVDGLTGFQTYWNNVQSEIGSMWVNKAEEQPVVVTRDGKEICYGKLSATFGDYNQVQVKLTEPIAESGEYKVQIKAGMIGSAVLDENYMTKHLIAGSENAAIELTFNVVLPIAIESTDPEDGSSVEEIKAIAVTWKNVQSEDFGLWNSNDKEAVEILKDGEHYGYAHLIADRVYNQSQITLDNPITEFGVYTFNIKAGVLGSGIINDLDAWPWVTECVPGTENEAASITITVEEKTHLTLASTDPEEGSIVEELYGVQTFWNNVQDENFGVFNFKDEQAVEILKDGQPYGFAKFNTQHGAYNQAQITLAEPIIEKGEYTFNIKAGAIGSCIIKDLDAWPWVEECIEGTENLAATFVIKVDPIVGVDSVEDAEFGISVNGGYISAPGAKLNVYDVSGTAVATGTDRIATETLAAGVYVVAAERGTEYAVIKVTIK